MDFITENQKQLMIKNGKMQNRREDRFPIIKLFVTNSSSMWLLSEIDSENQDIAFGLCDYGEGEPRLEDVSLRDLREITEKLDFMGRRVEQDISFSAKYSIAVYADAAKEAGEITEEKNDLERASRRLDNEKLKPS